MTSIPDDIGGLPWLKPKLAAPDETGGHSLWKSVDQRQRDFIASLERRGYSLPNKPAQEITTEEIREVFAKGPDPELAAAAARKAQEPDPLRTMDLAALAGVEPQPKQFVIGRIAPVGEVTLFTGPGSSGKSLLGQQLATAAAGGVNCLGLEVQPSTSLYLTCEDDEAELHWRQKHICGAMGLDMASLAGRLHLASLRGNLDNILTVESEKGEYQPSPSYLRLAIAIRSIGARLAILDNVAHLFGGNENDRGEVTQFVNLLNRLAGETGAAIILVGHPNKSGDEYSGSTAWPNAVRSRVYLEHDLDTDLRRLSLPKANYAAKGDVAVFRWHQFAFWLDEDLPSDTRKELAETIKANGDNRTFLTCLAERNKQRRHVSEKPTAQNYAPKIFEAMPESKGIGRKRLVAAMDRLFRIERIERGFIYRDTSEGKDIFGLREAPETSGNLSGNLPETCSGNLRKPAENDRKHPPISKDIAGAAIGPAATYDDAPAGHGEAAQ
jgi:RecA-family ATPase